MLLKTQVSSVRFLFVLGFLVTFWLQGLDLFKIPMKILLVQLNENIA